MFKLDINNYKTLIENILWRLLELMIKVDHLFLLLTFLAIISLFFNCLNLMHILFLINSILLLFVCIFPIGQWLAFYLERYFPENPPIPHNIEGIIVLGSGFDLLLSYKLNRPCYNFAIGRLISFCDLIRQHPDVKHVFTGGGWYVEFGVNESVLAEEFFRSCGLDTQQIIFEREARNTYENALYSYRLIQPKGTWVLVTSALHMPRSVGLFKKLGWKIIPYPVDYHSETKWSFFNFNLSQAIVFWKTSMHEIAGMLINHINGLSDTLFPNKNNN